MRAAAPVGAAVTAPVESPALGVSQPAAISPSRPAAALGNRGIVTDYGYVVGELRRILILTAGILALLVVLWLIL